MNKTGRSRNKQQKLENYCEFCHKIIIGSSYKFKSHLFKHDAVKPRYNCDYCLKKFFRKDAFNVHINRHKGTVTQKSYICDYCERNFALKNNLIIHLRRIHDENIKTELGKYACSICKLSYCERRLLEQHIRREHFNLQFTKQPLHTVKSINETWIENVNNKNTTVSITKVNNNVIVIKKLKFDVKVKDTKPNNLIESKPGTVDQYSKGICDYCKKEMLKKSLRTHIKEVHMDLRNFQCKVCKDKFSRHYQLTEHNCGHIRKRYKKNHIVSVIKKKDLQSDSDSKLTVFKKEP